VTDDKFVNFPQLDLIHQVLSSSVSIPEDKLVYTGNMCGWCLDTFGEPRQLDILYEAMQGKIEDVVGSWCFLTGVTHNLDCIMWFCNPVDRALFTLTWL